VISKQCPSFFTKISSKSLTKFEIIGRIQTLHQKEVSESHVENAKWFTDWTVKVSAQSWNLDKEIPAHGKAHSCRQVLIDKGPMVVVSLIPNDSIKKWSCDENSKSRKHKSKVF
jgi:hypothetical protein